MIYQKPESLYERLNWVGKIMLDTARVMGAARIPMTPDYMQRVLRNIKPTPAPEV